MFAADLQTDLPKSTKTKNMKKNLLTLATILTIGFFTNNVTAQTNSEATTTVATPVSARLIKPMTLIAGTPLDFGTINLIGAALGTVTMDAVTSTTVPVYTGDAKAGVATGTTASLATYTANGSDGLVYNITVPDNSTVVIKDGAGANPMTVTDFTVYNSVNAIKLGSSGTLTGGTDTFKVGAKLNIPASQVGGTYTGSFVVKVDYN